MRVNSWNGWDPLRHVLVGRADGTMVQAPEPAVQRDFPADGFPLGTYGPMPEEMTAAANEQLDAFAVQLAARGVQVSRPTPIDFSQPVSTPDWEHPTGFGCMPPRDVLITVGNEILEATMCYRSRWFEYLCYRPVLQELFEADPDMRWEAAPKPRLTDASFVPGFWNEYQTLSKAEQLARVAEHDLVLTEEEPLFDAADIARFGVDLFVQLSLVTNRKGVDWLRRHFPDHRVHEVTFTNTHPLHIDATWVPLRPGLVLHNGERPADPELVKYFEVNDWQVVEAVQPASWKHHPRLSFCSPWLAVNILNLDPRTVCVEAEEVRLAEQLDGLGMEVVPVPFRAVGPFGGGLHCATVDIWREGGLEDYFPNRCGRF
ncbi:glycine amidinotransferase [Actinoplanes lobatus]|uniref:Glycine amidinotransferase n=1 Tax=Actinoplanes lobatus TaxID=113568 RepID=A0A7W7HP10_9ACTN|nr:serine/threonine protein kinase [Actinoplanes lobatus]MBB4754056.1 glycine amidinotransferase [Actinoplanes lobatus]GGN76635.1 glycine amidinotransferase [Actinoplanes lobatus]GIE40888.1 glycine amidinotransferase [Actinoplanes lobatus]